MNFLYKKKAWFILIFFTLFVIGLVYPAKIRAALITVSGKAKVLNTGHYLDFDNYNSNVECSLSSSAFSGYVFSQDLGWIDFADTGVSTDIVVPAGFTLNSPSGYSKDFTRPTLVFKKSTSGDVSSYSVSLDDGKNQSWSTAGIPSSGSNSAHYIWKDDSDVKIEFLNENDSDISNDEIRVYFKGLNSSELTEGAHLWKVTAYDNAGNSKEESKQFYIDKSNPFISDLAIADLGLVFENREYFLPPADLMPSFSGLASDYYQGSTKTNSNGTTDTFEKTSSGPETLTLILKKLVSGFPGSSPVWEDHLTQEYAVTNLQTTINKTKESRFYITTPYPLENGYYKVALTLKDKAGNSYSSPVFYLSLNYYQQLGQGGVPASRLSPKPEAVPEMLQTEIVEEEQIPAETEEEKEQVKQQGIKVSVKVIDVKQQPVAGAKVTLFSEPKTSYTNNQGWAYFGNVEKGEHTLKIAYQDYEGEEKLDLTGDDIKEHRVTVVIKKSSSLINWFYLFTSIFVFIIFVLLFLLLKRKKDNQN
jgi:hypothetical protein